MPTSTRPVVLCVDDEVRSLETLERTLDEEFDVLTANSAQEALRLLEDNDVQVILCDQRMPDRTGVELLTEVDPSPILGTITCFEHVAYPTFSLSECIQQKRFIFVKCC